MRRLSIKTAMVTIFVLIALIVGGMSALALSSLSRLNNSTTEIAGDSLPSIRTAGEIKFALADERLTYARHLLMTTPEQTAAEDEAAATKVATTDASIKSYQPLISSPTEAEILKNIEAQAVEFRAAAATLLDLSRTGSKTEATALFNGEMRKQAQEMAAAVDELKTVNVDSAAAATALAESTFNTTVNLFYIAIGVSLLIVLGAALFAMIGVVRPITLITASMRFLASGDTAKAIPFAGRADEIGSMAGAVEIFRQNAITKTRMEAEAESNRLASEQNRIDDQKRAEDEAAERMRVATSGLAAGLKRLASGDLAFQLTESFAADFEPLRVDFNTSVAQLGTTLESIANSVGTISNGSREISLGANDLAKRTEQQAAALEETAAALDQITVNVSLSSKRTQEAQLVASEASIGATKSGIVVDEAVNAMSRIEESSTKIASIISVIQEIAFQTNLLALNAGVEAARAGEAGRGFAVVAQEVRELAQRSATAAREIKELIEASSKEVSGGVKLVNETGDALRNISGYIVRINDHMEAITTASREQSSGLAEVNIAVNELDQTTQKNAAMVEETDAAAGLMSDEAMNLRELVGQFRLAGTAGAATRANPVHVLQAAARRVPAQPAQRTAQRAAGGGQAAAKEWSDF